MAAVLVALPDRAMGASVAEGLSQLGHHVLTASDGEKGVRLAYKTHLDLVITDARLSRTAGRPLLTWLRAHPDHQSVPVVMLGVGDAQEDLRVHPLMPPVPVAEVIAVGLRVIGNANAGPEQPVNDSAGIHIDAARLLVTGPAGSQRLTATEYRLLRQLAQAKGGPVSRSQLAAALGRGNRTDRANAAGRTDSLRVHLSNLRKKLTTAAGGAAPLLVPTADGYRLVDRQAR